MLKLMGKKIFTILRSKFLFNLCKVKRIIMVKLFAPCEIFHTFLLSADLFKVNFFGRKKIRNTISVSNRLVPDLAQCFVWSDLGPIC